MPRAFLVRKRPRQDKAAEAKRPRLAEAASDGAGDKGACPDRGSTSSRSSVEEPLVTEGPVAATEEALGHHGSALQHRRRSQLQGYSVTPVVEQPSASDKNDEISVHRHLDPHPAQRPAVQDSDDIRSHGLCLGSATTTERSDAKPIGNLLDEKPTTPCPTALRGDSLSTFTKTSSSLSSCVISSSSTLSSRTPMVSSSLCTLLLSPSLSSAMRPSAGHCSSFLSLSSMTSSLSPSSNMSSPPMALPPTSLSPSRTPSQVLPVPQTRGEWVTGARRVSEFPSTFPLRSDSGRATSPAQRSPDFNRLEQPARYAASTRDSLLPLPPPASSSYMPMAPQCASFVATSPPAQMLGASTLSISSRSSSRERFLLPPLSPGQPHHLYPQEHPRPASPSLSAYPLCPPLYPPLPLPPARRLHLQQQQQQQYQSQHHHHQQQLHHSARSPPEAGSAFRYPPSPLRPFPTCGSGHAWPLHPVPVRVPPLGLRPDFGVMAPEEVPSPPGSALADVPTSPVLGVRSPAGEQRLQAARAFRACADAVDLNNNHHHHPLYGHPLPGSPGRPVPFNSSCLIGGGMLGEVGEGAEVDEKTGEKTQSFRTFLESAKVRVETINDGNGLKNPLLCIDKARSTSDNDPLSFVSADACPACPVCGLKCDTPRLLQRHVRGHKEVKRYLCAWCGKGFNDTFDLKRHTRTHTGVRPYKCDNCGKAFTQRCSLESHCRKIHGQRLPFSFNERRAKLYVCEECGHSTAGLEDHFRHLRAQHPEHPALVRPHYDRRQYKFCGAGADDRDSRDGGSDAFDSMEDDERS